MEEVRSAVVLPRLQKVKAWWEALDLNEGLDGRTQAMIFVLVMFLVFTRRPGELLRAEFYAEDGAVWYAQAYNLSWLHSLAIPAGGYFNTLQRLVAGFTLLFPLRFAPLLMNIAGMIAQTLPVTALLSRRCSTWGPLRIRTLMAALYVVVPNASEIHVVLTNAQWHWALLEVLLAFGAAPRSWKGRLCDATVFLVGGFSGPFCLTLLPLVLVFWWLRRQRWTLAIAALMLPGVLVQVYSILSTQRLPPAKLGASPMLFLRLLAGHVFIDSMAGANARSPMLPWPILLGMLVFGFAMVAFGFWRGGLSLRLFAVFAGVVFVAGLTTPLIAGPKPLWELLILDAGGRYWFFPMMVFVWSVMLCVVHGQGISPWLRRAGQAVLIVMIFGVLRQWVYRGFGNHHFPEYAAQFERLRKGQRETIPICPEPMKMTLTKR
jgi:hypothetical protein